MNWKAAFVFVACAAAVLAQTPPVSILEIDIEDAVLYVDDLGDPSRIASSPATSTLPGTYNRVFKWVIAVGDIVAVNGKPAKGLWVVRSIAPRYTATYTPGRAIADIDGNCAQDAQFSILQADGTPVGTIVAMGLGGTAPPPGAPTVSTAHDMVVVGG